MGRIVLSCNHEVYDFDYAHSIITKGTDRYGNFAIKYKTVCSVCKEMHKTEGVLFETQEDAYKWLTNFQKPVWS